MKKILSVLFVSFLFTIPAAHSKKFENYTCTIVGSEEIDKFKCINRVKKDSGPWDLVSGDKSFEVEVEPILTGDYKTELENEGVKFLDPLSFETVSFFDVVDNLSGSKSPYENDICFRHMKYTSGEFNKLPANHPTIKRLESLTAALKEAGICSVPVKADNTNHNLNIRNNDDLLEHFLCISNSESTFGRDNIGLGGRGPWGIHPMHNQKAGATTVNGVVLKKDQLCYPSKAITRNKSGGELKSSEGYLPYEVRLANAKCALKLYDKKAFSDWGKNNKWGSNRHCSGVSRDRLNFKKYLKDKVCCSKACKEKVNPTY